MAGFLTLGTGCSIAIGDYPAPVERVRPAEATLLPDYVEPAGMRFVLTGDLHCHSQESNGSGIMTSRVLADSVKVGYDFVALTDHNTLAQNQWDWSTPSLLVLSGMELSTNYGHFNVFGLTELADWRSDFASVADFNAYVEYLQGLGAVVQHNHPNRDRTPEQGFVADYGLQVDCVEILNKTINDEDKLTLQRDFQAMLASGIRRTGTAGSDAHRNYDIRSEYNHVWVSERSEVAVLYALAHGHSYVTTAPDGPVLSLMCGDAIMGDSVAYETGRSIDVYITGLEIGSIVRLFDADGQIGIDETVGSSAFYRAIPTEVDTGFVRVEVWRPDGGLVAFSNPLYID